MNKLRLTGLLLTRLLGLLLMYVSCVQVGYAQQSGGGNYPTGNGVRVKEVDGSPNVPGTQTLVFPNGSLTRAGQTVTVTIAGGAALTATQIGFGSGANTLTGSSAFTYTDSTGVVDLTKTLNSSVRFTVGNGSNGTAAQARFGASADVSGAALAAYSSGFTTSGLRTANSAVLDLDGTTSVFLGQSTGQFRWGLGTTEYARLTSTVFSLFGLSGTNTGLTVTSGASGAGVTLAVAGGGTNENLILAGKGTGNVTVSANIVSQAPQLMLAGNLNSGVGLGGTTLAGSTLFIGAGGTRVVEANSGAVIGWSSGTAGAGMDTGWQRFAAAVIRGSNLTTGAAQLLLGTSTDTANAQLSVYSQSTTRPGLKLRALTATSASQNMEEVYDASGTLSYAVRADGKIVYVAGNTASTVGAAGGASALPATPTGYLQVVIGGTTYKIPYYAD